MIKESQGRLISALYPGILIIGIVTFAFALLTYVYTGTHMRYSGDDYCYAGFIQKMGFWQAQVYSYTHDVPYHGDRFSLTFFSGLWSLFPPRFNGFIPGMAIIFWIVGLGLALSSVADVANLGLKPLEALLSSEILVFFSLYMTADIDQSLYWRSGMLPYVAPLIGVLFVIGFALWQSSNENDAMLSSILLFLGALIVGGFSEIGAVYQISLLSLGLMTTALFHNMLGMQVRSILIPWGGALMGSIFAIVLMRLSPFVQSANLVMQLPQDLLPLIELTLGHSLDYFLQSLSALPVPNIIIGLTFFILAGLQAPVEPRRKWETKGALLAIGFVLFVMLAGISSVMGPYAYAQGAYPEPRALILARFSTSLGLGMIGWILGNLMLRYLNIFPRYAMICKVFAGFLLFVLWFYPLRAGRQTIHRVQPYMRWARYWDVRDENIRAAMSAGQDEIEVMVLDHIIPRVAELSADSSLWYNDCAAMYYGVESIRATLPGWEHDLGE